MKPKSPISIELYEVLLDKGYPEPFCDLVTQNLNTDFTATRMIGYLRYHRHLPEGEVVDEMLAILDERNRIMQKKKLEATNARWNEMMQNGWPFINDDDN